VSEPTHPWQFSLELHPDQPPLSHQDRSLVAGAVGYFDRERYALHAWAVLDRSVHVVFSPTPTWRPSELAAGWRRFTTTVLAESPFRAATVWRGEGALRVLEAGAPARAACREVLALPRGHFPSGRGYGWVSAAVLAAEVLDQASRVAEARAVAS